MDNLANTLIQQFTRQYGKRTLVYTLIDDGTEWQLWAHFKGYGKATLLYGGLSRELCKAPINLDYAMDKETLRELTGEDD